MATWNDLRNYIHSKYTVAEERPGIISLVFDVPQERTQMVIVSHAEMSLTRDQWVQIESGVALRRRVGDLWPILDELSKFVVGGLSVDGEYLTVRHAVPLADMSVDEFEVPLDAVTRTADALESMISRVDAL